jgi:hypothetical protein
LELRLVGANCLHGEFGQETEFPDIAVGKGVGLFFEGFDQAADTLRCAQGDGDDGADAEFAAGVAVDASIGFGVVAADNCSSNETYCSQARTQIQRQAQRRGGLAGGSATDNRVAFRQSDGDAAGATDGQSAFGNELQDLIANLQGVRTALCECEFSLA